MSARVKRAALLVIVRVGALIIGAVRAASEPVVARDPVAVAVDPRRVP